MRSLITILILLFSETAWAIGPAEAASLANEDCAKLPVDAQLHAAYFWTGPIVAEKELETFYKVFCYHLNCLSREADLKYPTKVSSQLWRIDIRDYGWSREVYNKLADVDPYFHTKIQTVLVPAVVIGVKVRTIKKCSAFYTKNGKQVEGELEQGTEFTITRLAGDNVFYQSDVGEIQVSKSYIATFSSQNTPVGEAVTAAAPWLPSKEMQELITKTQNTSPILRADWFFATTARQLDLDGENSGVGYYNFLGIKNQKDAEELAGLDRKKIKEVIKREIAAIVPESGVAINNRQIFRFGTVAGAWWETRDVINNKNKRNAKRQLDDDFQFDAMEVYFTLPNRLWGLIALNNKGELQNTVPDTIAKDKESTSNDPKIHPGLSCIRCHKEGLRPIDDWIRPFYADPPGDVKLVSPDKEKEIRLTRLYLADLKEYYTEDVAIYTKTLKRLTGWKPEELALSYAETWRTYAEVQVSLESFASELGVEKEMLIDSFKQYALPQSKGGGNGQDPILIGYLKNPAFTARREEIEEVYSLAQQAIIAYRGKEKGKKK